MAGNRVLIVALYLPVTVNFEQSEDVNSPGPKLTRTPSKVRIGDYEETPDEPQASVVDTSVSSGERQPSEIPSATDDYFSRDIEASKTPSGHKRHSSVGTLGMSSMQLTPSELPAPVWGSRGKFFQPKSRAQSPPPASIITRSGAQSHATSIDLNSDDEEEARSLDDKLKEAHWTLEAAEQGNGSLRNAVHAACREDPDLKTIWIGTLGMPTDALDDDKKQEIEVELSRNDCHAVFPTDSDMQGHYAHYCKIIMWPIMHYQIPDGPKSKAYEDQSWVYYVKINQLFADEIVKTYKRGDTIWIHDYHLMLVPDMVRKKLPEAKIGLFIHIAFPSSEAFRCIMTRKELLRGMLGACMIGFQTPEYGVHFLQTCSRLLLLEARDGGIQLDDRFVRVEALPIGIDLKELQIRRRHPEVLDSILRIKNKYPGKFLIFSRDKLDNVHGLRQKLKAYELFLKTYPTLAENTVLVQFVSDTVQSTEVENSISTLVGKILSKHATVTRQPLTFIRQNISYDKYLAMATLADAMMITSLREGMNLTSHEFIVCQDGEHGNQKHGSLILSEFTGSSRLFAGKELVVNPWDARQCAEAIRKAIEMDPREKAERWTGLINCVCKNDAATWFNTFLSQLDSAWIEQSRQNASSVPRLSGPDLDKSFQAAERRLLLVGFEGTLINHDSPKWTFNDPNRAIQPLADLAKKGSILYVLSGKTPDELNRWLLRAPGVGIVAENGGYIQYHDHEQDQWTELADIEESAKWIREMTGLMQYFVERMEGAKIQERKCSIILDTESAKDQDNAERLLPDLIAHINETGQDIGVRGVPFPGGVLVESTKWNKETAAKHILNHLGLSTPDFLLVVGNSREDEVLYCWAHKLGEDGEVNHVTTVSVSARNTEAQTTLTQGVVGVNTTLQRLAQLE